MATATQYEQDLDELFAVLPEFTALRPNTLESPDADDQLSLSGDEILARIDETLDLIAAADRDVERIKPLDHVDISIIIPVRNARHSLPDVLDRINEVMPPATETIIVDDASTDGSWQFARTRVRQSRITLVRRRCPHGRGSAIRCGIRHSVGHVVAITEPNMSYDPADLLGAIWPILEDRADAVYGSRNLRRDTQRASGISSLLQRWGDHVATSVSNRRSGLNLSDLHNPQKVFRGEMIRQLDFMEAAEGFDAEVTAKIANVARVVMEVPTHFDPESLPNNALSPSLWSSLRATFAQRT